MRSTPLGIFTIALITGMLFIAPTFSSAYADVKDDNPGQAKGCEKSEGKGKSKAGEKNPHCDVEPPCTVLTWYLDEDNDGWGATGEVTETCDDLSVTHSLQPGDCNDKDPTENPDATGNLC
ncbi:MAG: hypothetical protein GWN01_13645 [Nitrosopumilaceae archaeon]|nr:hypothetical protein [Nitrosopumilaceae archaeon]NIU01908.1 hypothetical protein [Nitrosopumilaceae archaeon]NIU88312.1 hypothetical protein [Nitrosopumilaceae archaeon]NIV66604.1 hypothetical protein [Nitrosopumilaceae archaeon]NIX62509.1 hypothetical protein [Nitrosopumilaceae archaeon]